MKLNVEQSAMLDEADFQIAVEAALSAPSGDNCQPFLFKNTRNGVLIFHDGQRAAHFLNAGSVGSNITLGCVFECIAIAMSTRGFGVHFDLLDPIDASDRGLTPVARFTLSSPGAVPRDPLADVLFQRHTDRRMFQGGNLPGPISRQLLSSTDSDSNIGLRTTEISEGPLLDSICWLDRLIWEHKAGHRDLMQWLRLSQKEILLSDDGMPWTTLGVRKHELIALRLSRSWKVQQIVNLLGAPRMIEGQCRKLLQSSAGLVLFTLKQPGSTSELEAGRLALRTWVTLNAAGYGVQPMSIAPIMCYLAGTDNLPDLAPTYVDRIKTLAPQFSDAFSLAPNEQPVWMLRTGKSDPLPEEWRCLRRSWRAAVIKDG